jgi:hypothetical protein
MGDPFKGRFRSFLRESSAERVNYKVSLPDLVQVIHIGNHLTGVLSMMLKVAILLEWLSIFTPKRKGHYYWTSIALICFLCLWGGAGRFIESFHCIPFQKIWDKTVPGTCSDYRTFNLIAAIISVATDVILIVLPQSVIWKLQMTLSRKIGISIIFATGVV